MRCRCGECASRPVARCPYGDSCDVPLLGLRVTQAQYAMRARLLIMSRLLGVLALARGLVVALACMIGGPTAASEPPAVAGSGHVDKITVDSRKREIVLEGWAAPTRPNAEISFIAVNVGRQEV